MLISMTGVFSITRLMGFEWHERNDASRDVGPARLNEAFRTQHLANCAEGEKASLVQGTTFGLNEKHVHEYFDFIWHWVVVWRCVW